MQLNLPTKRLVRKGAAILACREDPLGRLHGRFEYPGLLVSLIYLNATLYDLSQYPQCECPIVRCAESRNSPPQVLISRYVAHKIPSDIFLSNIILFFGS
jgi:hypothetical protein